MSQKCPKCGKFVGKGQTVCDSCKNKYIDTCNALVSLPRNVRKKTDDQNFDDDYLIDFVAVELKKDISFLMSLGIKLEKGALAAKTGGTAWAGYEAFTGDWLSALVIGGLSFLAVHFTKSYNRIKLMEMKKKWMDKLSGLSQEELNYLSEGLQRKYPLLLGSFQNLLKAGQD
jgi:hypothetical protein